LVNQPFVKNERLFVCADAPAAVERTFLRQAVWALAAVAALRLDLLGAIDESVQWAGYLVDRGDIKKRFVGRW
jgi:hypothetical protein